MESYRSVFICIMLFTLISFDKEIPAFYRLRTVNIRRQKKQNKKK